MGNDNIAYENVMDRGEYKNSNCECKGALKDNVEENEAGKAMATDNPDTNMEGAGVDKVYSIREFYGVDATGVGDDN